MTTKNKKRARLALTELEAEMEVLQVEDLRTFKGGNPNYDYDCFWRSLVYLKFGQLEDDVAVNQLAEYFARDFFMYCNDWTCDQADEYLKQHGSGMTVQNIIEFMKYSRDKGGLPFSGGYSNYMGYFSPQDMPSAYNYTGYGHVVVMKERNEEGATIVDPANKYRHIEISNEEANKLKFISY